MTVHLVGGPRPNPDDVFCLKNLLSFNNNFGRGFPEERVQFNLKFNFAVVDSTVSLKNNF